MFYIKHLLVILGTAVLFISSAASEEFKLVVPFPPGNQTDSVARLIQASVGRNTSDHLVIENVPGGEFQVGVSHFKNNKRDAIMSLAGMTITNPLTKENLAYSDKDFEHIIFVGTSIALWVVKADSKIKTPTDLIKYTPELVGGFSPGLNYNLYALIDKYKIKSTIVPYKGSNDVIVALLGDSLEMGIMAPSTNLIQQVNAGKLRIIGSSYKNDLVMNDMHIPAANKQLGIELFNGFIGIAIQPNMDPARAEKIKKLLWSAMNDPIVVEGLKNLYLLPDASNDQVAILKFYENSRTTLKQFLKKSNLNNSVTKN
jgi:tripartite-type tricarboxylate transporter receptor subunit TctC